MKDKPSLNRVLGAGLCVVVLGLRPASSHAGSQLPTCAVSPSPCLRSMTLAQSSPTGMGLAGFPGGTVTLVLTLTTRCLSCPPFPCTTPATLTAARVAVNVYAGGTDACLPAPPADVPAFSFTSSVIVPACTTNGAFTSYNVVVPVPAAAPLGFYCAYSSVTVTFSDGMTLTSGSVTSVCIVQQAAGMPGEPRLSLRLLSESAPRVAPGDMVVASYLVRNNEPNPLLLTVTANSRQSAVRPQGANERQGVFSIANPFGDDFPIAFNPGTNCIPLPQRPYTQPEISNPTLVIPAGGTNVITIGMRSFGQDASGACSEGTLKVTGTFADGSPAQACAGMALIVDTSIPSPACARAVNDCNQNGIPDALDIEAGRSQDRNYNALPDECEQFINVPTSTSVSPTNPAPGAPITVHVAFNEVVPMQSVWASGQPLTRMTIGGLPFWQGTIPADIRPGPQTVYFLGRDQQGGLATYIAAYTVPVPRITRISLDGSRDVILEHNGVQVGRSLFVQENPNLSCPTCWTNRPNGPHASPHNAGPANGQTRFFRLHD